MSDIPVDTRGAIVPSRTSQIVSTDAIIAALIVLLVASFSLVVIGVFRQPVNGDEYIFLGTIHHAANGGSVSIMQTAYVHLFGWLPLAADNEIIQVVLGRLVNVAMWAASLTLLFGIARRLIDPVGALAGVVLFAVFSYSIVNAASFRIDGLLLPMLLSVAMLLLNPTIGRVAAAGALSGLAVAFTIKAVLWAPAFIGVLAVGLWHSQDRVRPVVAGALAGTASFAGVMLLHAQLISTRIADVPVALERGSSHAGRYMLFNGFVPQWELLKHSVLANPGTWILLGVGVCLALAGLRQAHSRRNSLILLLLALPLLSVTFYTNAFPYAYLVLMPTACILAGLAFSTFLKSGERPKRIVALGCLGIAALQVVHYAWEYRNDRQERQRQIVTEVHRLFPEPVAYIDISGMVASFPRLGINITWYGLDSYNRAGVPAYPSYIRSNEPPLLIANSKLLDVWDEEELESVGTRLLPQDEEAIRATYAHYWDQIWLAGRQWRDLASGETRAFEIVVPGDHTLIAGEPVVVDGKTYQPWTTIRLEEGPHELQTTAAEADLRILWGTRLKPLEDLPPSLTAAEQ